MEQGDIVKAHCNSCAGDRKHLIVHLHQGKWSDEIAEDTFVNGEERYELLQCAGCETITLRHTSFHSESTDDDGRPVPTVTYYPPATFRRPPRWLHGLLLPDGDGIAIIFPPDFITRLLKEIYAALHGSGLSLAAMGVRALLEAVMIDRINDRGSFKKNLAAFQAEGHVSATQRDILEATLEFGHASIHRGYVPSREDVTQALDITENIIELLYVSGAQAAALRKRIPPRGKKN